jgi:DNA-binding LacI/PurR family transcriptional regulator
LTTIRMPIAEMAAAAVHAAIDTEPDGAPAAPAVYKPTLVVRRSSGPVPVPVPVSPIRPASG